MSTAVYRDADNDRFVEYRLGNRAGRVSWHSDVVRSVFLIPVRIVS